MAKQLPPRQGLFDHDTLTVKFGGPKTPEDKKFVATAIKVPPYTYSYKERESLGGGWYGATQTVTDIEDNEYIIIKDGFCIGTMNPYSKAHKDIKSVLMPISKRTHNKVMEFIKSQNIEVKNL